MDVASGQSPMQQPLETLVNICSTESATDMMTADDSHGTEEDPIIVSTQEKDCRLVYNLQKRKEMKTSTYLRTPYTNPLKKSRETTDVEVHPQETKRFEVCPLILEEELLELQRWMNNKNDWVVFQEQIRILTDLQQQNCLGLNLHLQHMAQQVLVDSYPTRS